MAGKNSHYAKRHKPKNSKNAAKSKHKKIKQNKNLK